MKIATDRHHIPTSAIYVFLGHLQISYKCTKVSTIYRFLPALGAKEDELDPLPWLNVSVLISLTAVICPVIIFKIVKRRLSSSNLDFSQKKGWSMLFAPLGALNAMLRYYPVLGPARCFRPVRCERYYWQTV